MASTDSVPDVIEQLAREPLRHIVLLKQLIAYPRHVRVRRVNGAEGAATLVELDTSVSPYDLQAYPTAAIAAFISSDHPGLTASLMPHVSRGTGIVFKLSSKADLPAVASWFAVERRTGFISFTSAGASAPVPGVHLTAAPSDAAFRLFEVQGHARAWLEPLLQAGDAFVCVLERGGVLVSACFAFAIYGSVWEVGGVVTASSHRRSGFGASVVRAALAELARRRLVPRYQVEEFNEASIGLARSAGLVAFLTITHYLHDL